MEHGGGVYADHLDTPRRVATDDTDAQIVWKWESKPFGETEASGEITFNLRFPGQYFDTELKTHYNINRDYNPVTGRYIQSDPIGFDGGLNTYVYVGGKPIILIDSSGKYYESVGYAGIKDANYKTIAAISDELFKVDKMDMDEFNDNIAYLDSFDSSQEENFHLAKDRIVLQLSILMNRHIGIAGANGIVLGWKGFYEGVIQVIYNYDDTIYLVGYLGGQDSSDPTTYNVSDKLEMLQDTTPWWF